MNEEHSRRNQVDALVNRFKRTGVVPPVQEWKPEPTAGDHARALTQEITQDRDAELPLADQTSQVLFNTKPV